MKTSKISLWLAGAAFAVAAFVTPARADDPHNLDITVYISATKSLSVNATYYDFSAMSVNTSSVSVSSITVTNTSGALIETYTLQGANAASTGGGNTWTLAASPAANTYALAGQFSTAQPNNVDGDWSSDDLTTSAITATDTVLGNGTLAQAGASVMPGAVRGLWFRLKTPTAVSDTTQHKATLTLAVQ
jgi:hypothetical protein